MNPYKNFALVLSANFETLAYISAAWYGGKYLNENHPIGFDWNMVTYVFGLLLIARSWYVVFRLLLQAQKNSIQDDKRDKKSSDS